MGLPCGSPAKVTYTRLSRGSRGLSGAYRRADGSWHQTGEGPATEKIWVVNWLASDCGRRSTSGSLAKVARSESNQGQNRGRMGQRM